MSDQFASLIGHQNSRQKIRYVKKIRDENTALKMVRKKKIYRLLCVFMCAPLTGNKSTQNGALET